mmetsp:Transcript_3671/g.6169  ORF Transcript_3671/g.6169 Transcript_3671/m.6169 type:complete len:143 (+) Transcript_3671:1065-1493(+)
MIDDVPSKTALIVAVLLVIVHTANDKVTPPGAAKAQLDLLKKVTLVNAGPLWFLTKNVSFCRFLCIICHTVVVPKFAEGLGFRELFMDQSVRKFLRSNKASKRGWFSWCCTTARTSVGGSCGVRHSMLQARQRISPRFLLGN